MKFDKKLEKRKKISREKWKSSPAVSWEEQKKEEKDIEEKDIEKKMKMITCSLVQVCEE